MIKNMKTGEVRLVSAPLEFKDKKTGWTVQEGEKVTVANAQGEENEFYVERLWWNDEMLLIGTKSPSPYTATEPTKEREKLIASFDQRGAVYGALHEITAALEQREFKKDALRLRPGDTATVSDPRDNRARLRVFKIIGGILMLIDSSSGLGLSLADRLLMAWQVFKGSFFGR